MPPPVAPDTIRLFAISKLGWIRQQQSKLRAQERETEREYIDRESHHVWGKRLLLRVIEAEARPSVEVRHSVLVLTVRPGTDRAGRESACEAWYRQQVRDEVPALVATWAPRLAVSLSSFGVRRMRTRWGTCNPVSRSILLNTELAKKPKECLEYIVVHELAHLREATHGPGFLGLMDRTLPDWRRVRDLLERLPARHEDWTY